MAYHGIQGMMLPMEIPLYELCPNRRGRILRLTTAGAMRRRLMDLGFVPGAEVECLFCNAGGSLTAYAIRGAVIALRRLDAAGILVIEE